MTEEEFRRKVLNVAAVEDSMTVEEFNDTILTLCEGLLARRSRDRRLRVAAQRAGLREAAVRREHEQRAALDAEDGIFYAHMNGLDCGRAFCLVCNPEVEQS